VKEEGSLDDVVRYWTEKAEESLASAVDELKAGRLSFSVNRVYYACFYIVSALLLKHRLKFKKHSGVRACFHKNFVKSGLISKEYGKFYDEVFEARQRGDYIELVKFEENDVKVWIEKAKDFLTLVKKLLNS